MSTLVGRSRSADLRIEQEVVSAHHATIQWSGTGWTVRDLGSRNGTFVNERRLKHSALQPLGMGDRVGFGGSEQLWRLVDDGPPLPLARGPERRVAMGQPGLLAIPGPEAPAVTVMAARSGTWRIEGSNETREVADQQTVVVGGEPWLLRLPDGPLVPTAGVRSLQLARAQLSIDGEGGPHPTRLRIIHEPHDFSVDLGSTAPLFRLLARAAAEGTWVPRDRLVQGLGVNTRHLNVLVFRLRQQLNDAGFEDGVQVIERRRGYLRLGTRSVTVAERH